MVACPKCALNNTIDSAFCRKCGYALPQDLVAEAQNKLKELVNKGMTSFNEGNTEEAMGIAEHAVMANPAYPEGHALKGMVHERRSEYAQALDCFETVVSLNPDSTIDKIKLNQLRNAFAQRTAEPKVDRKGALMAAMAAVLLVSSVGAITYRVVSSSKETPANSAQTSGTTQGNLVSNQNPVNPINPGNPGTTISNPAPSTPGNQLTDDGVKPLGGDESTDNSSNRGGLPKPRDNGWRTNQIDPVTPNGPIGSRPPRNQNNGGGGTGLPPVTGNGNENNGGGSVPSPSNPPSRGTEDTPPPTKPITDGDKDPGQIDIKITNAKGASGSEAVRRSANEMLKGGDNESAAKAFESAAKAGSGGKAHQRQAQALNASGKRAEAVAAYERAISAYESDLKAGRGNADANQAGLNSSKAALRALKN